MSTLMDGAPAAAITDVDQTFPRLTEEQVARIALRGRVRHVEHDDILSNSGSPAKHVFVARTASINIVMVGESSESVVREISSGEFTGEVSTLSGRPSVATLRVGRPGNIIEFDRDDLLSLVHTDADLSEIFIRAFLLRRAALVAGGGGDVTLIGSNRSADTIRIKEFLARNAHPYRAVDPDRDPVTAILTRYQITREDLPVLVFRGTTILKNPSNAEVARCLGFNIAVERSRTRDVVILGAGPAGLAAAVYAASEGLDALVIESHAPGGQAGASSRIENYLGFPYGISGQELTSRAYTQARKFGADLIIAESATNLSSGPHGGYTIEIDNGSRITARTVIIATGVEYRKLPLQGMTRFEGAGVYYGASFIESQLTEGEEVIVVGGGNAAGQAALFLSASARSVRLLVRSKGLGQTMSRYLIHRLVENPAIALHPLTQLTAVHGDSHLESVEWRSLDGESASRSIRHVFVMTGASPSAKWLEGNVCLDEQGFVRTGSDLTQADLAAAGWPLARLPQLLETSRPGVFAVGDVRAGSVKRVASAVGEGSIAVTLIHRALAEGRTPGVTSHRQDVVEQRQAITGTPGSVLIPTSNRSTG